VTEWNSYRRLDLGRLRSLLQSPVLIDLRNIYTPEEVSKFGFRYDSLGRKRI
jgi:UDPglucose 6-dehydrogenase